LHVTVKVLYNDVIDISES